MHVPGGRKGELISLALGEEEKELKECVRLVKAYGTKNGEVRERRVNEAFFYYKPD